MDRFLNRNIKSNTGIRWRNGVNKNEEYITKLSENNTKLLKNIVEEVQKVDGKRLYMQEELKSIHNLNS